MAFGVGTGVVVYGVLYSDAPLIGGVNRSMSITNASLEQSSFEVRYHDRNL